MSQVHRDYLVKLLDKAESTVTTRLFRIEHDIKLKAEVSRRITQAELALKTITLKSINEVLREYEDALERYVVDTVNGNMTAGEMSRAHKALLRRLAHEAYIEGLREGGISDPESQMEDEDDMAIDDWIADQSQYTLDFAKSCSDASKESGDDKRNKRDALLDRVGEWVNSLNVLGKKGYLSAKGNMPLTWQVGDTEHCDTCMRLDGQRHRAQWFIKRDYIPRQPGSHTLDCNGYNCQCSLVDDDGSVVMP